MGAPANGCTAYIVALGLARKINGIKWRRQGDFMKQRRMNLSIMASMGKGKGDPAVACGPCGVHIGADVEEMRP